MPVLRAELSSVEPVGLDALRSFADGLYGDRDPAAVLHVSEPLRVETVDGRARLVQALPFGTRDELEVGRRDDELLVRVGPYRRAILLPDSLRQPPGGRRPTAARGAGGGVLVTDPTGPDDAHGAASANGARPAPTARASNRSRTPPAS